MLKMVDWIAEADADSLFRADFVIGRFRRPTFRKPYLGGGNAAAFAVRGIGAVAHAASAGVAASIGVKV